MASLWLGDYRIVVTGELAASPGLAMALMGVVRQLDREGRLDLAPLAGLSVESLTIRDAAGQELLRTGALNDTDLRFVLNARSYGEWLSGQRDAGGDDLVGRAGNVASLILARRATTGSTARGA